MCQAVLAADRTDRAECVCVDYCPSLPNRGNRGLRDPGLQYGYIVCGSDGRSYESECALGVASCRMGRNLTVVGRGPCSAEAGQDGNSSEDVD